MEPLGVSGELVKLVERQMYSKARTVTKISRKRWTKEKTRTRGV